MDLLQAGTTQAGSAPTSQPAARSAPTSGTVGTASKFKPPRKTTPTAQAGTSASNKRRKRAPTS